MSFFLKMAFHIFTFLLNPSKVFIYDFFQFLVIICIPHITDVLQMSKSLIA